jgi:UDP-glucose 6-dehydrogenase
MSTEPVAVVNGAVTLVEAAIALAAGFHITGVDLDSEKMALIMAVVVAIGNLVKTLWARGQVTPVTDPRNNDGKRLVPE